jgi:hypothetical protein
MAQIEVGEAYEATTSALQAAKGQRLSLRRAIGGLEQALTQTPATFGVEETGAWLDRLGGALDHLDEVFAVHVQVTEGAGGLYEEIVENAPRMANRVKRFRREHADIGAAIQRGIADAKVAGARLSEHDAGELEALRDHAVRLLADLVRHRKRGLDLVYEAYHVDIGGES